ncbi:hypothetical protein HK405_007965, partial [Cladochytrium tenue]
MGALFGYSMARPRQPAMPSVVAVGYQPILVQPTQQPPVPAAPAAAESAFLLAMPPVPPMSPPVPEETGGSCCGSCCGGCCSDECGWCAFDSVPARAVRAAFWTLLVCIVLAFVLVPVPRSTSEELIVGDRKMFELASGWLQSVDAHSDIGSDVEAFLLSTKPTVDEMVFFPRKT